MAASRSNADGTILQGPPGEAAEAGKGSTKGRGDVQASRRERGRGKGRGKAEERNVGAEDDNIELCGNCSKPLADGRELRTLGCGHRVHHECFLMSEQNSLNGKEIQCEICGAPVATHHGMLSKAIELKSEGRTVEYFNILCELVQSDPANGTFTHLLGLAFLHGTGTEEDPTRAEELLRSAYWSGPAAKLALARLLLETGDWDEAFAIVRGVVESLRRGEERLLRDEEQLLSKLLLILCFELSDVGLLTTAESVRVIERASALIERGTGHHFDGNLDEALQCFEEAAHNTGAPSIMVKLGDVLTQRGDLEAALNLCPRGLALFRGRLYALQGDSEASFKAYMEAYFRGNPLAALNLAFLAKMEGNEVLATRFQADADILLHSAEKQSQPVFDGVRVRLKDEGKLRAALDEEEVQEHPEHQQRVGATAALCLGYILMMQREDDEAETFLKKSIEWGSPWARRFLARLYEITGQEDLALQQYHLVSFHREHSCRRARVSWMLRRKDYVAALLFLTDPEDSRGDSAASPFVRQTYAFFRAQVLSQWGGSQPQPARQLAPKWDWGPISLKNRKCNPVGHAQGLVIDETLKAASRAVYAHLQVGKSDLKVGMAQGCRMTLKRAQEHLMTAHHFGLLEATEHLVKVHHALGIRDERVLQLQPRPQLPKAEPMPFTAPRRAARSGASESDVAATVDGVKVEEMAVFRIRCKVAELEEHESLRRILSELRAQDFHFDLAAHGLLERGLLVRPEHYEDSLRNVLEQPPPEGTVCCADEFVGILREICSAAAPSQCEAALAVTDEHLASSSVQTSKVTFQEPTSTEASADVGNHRPEGGSPSSMLRAVQSWHGNMGQLDASGIEGPPGLEHPSRQLPEAASQPHPPEGVGHPHDTWQGLGATAGQDTEELFLLRYHDHGGGFRKACYDAALQPCREALGQEKWELWLPEEHILGVKMFVDWSQYDEALRLLKRHRAEKPQTPEKPVKLHRNFLVVSQTWKERVEATILKECRGRWKKLGPDGTISLGHVPRPPVSLKKTNPTQTERLVVKKTFIEFEDLTELERRTVLISTWAASDPGPRRRRTDGESLERSSQGSGDTRGHAPAAGLRLHAAPASSLSVASPTFEEDETNIYSSGW